MDQHPLPRLSGISVSLIGLLALGHRAEKQATVFHEQGAVEALLEMLGMFKLDEVFLRQAVRTLLPLCGQDGEKSKGVHKKSGR